MRIDFENSPFDVRGRILMVKIHLEAGEFFVGRAGEIPLGEQAGELMERPPSWHLAQSVWSLRVEQSLPHLKNHQHGQK